MVAAISRWHAQHDLAAREFNRRLGNGETMVVAGPALVESYSVLTRLPPPNRLSPRQAFTLLESNFTGPEVETISLTVAQYLRVLQEGRDHGIAGGRIYDAVIVACAELAGAEVLLTFNERHFRALAPDSVRIVVPS